MFYHICFLIALPLQLYQPYPESDCSYSTFFFFPLKHATITTREGQADLFRCLQVIIKIIIIIKAIPKIIIVTTTSPGRGKGRRASPR